MGERDYSVHVRKKSLKIDPNLLPFTKTLTKLNGLKKLNVKKRNHKIIKRKNRGIADYGVANG